MSYGTATDVQSRPNHLNPTPTPLDEVCTDLGSVIKEAHQINERLKGLTHKLLGSRTDEVGQQLKPVPVPNGVVAEMREAVDQLKVAQTIAHELISQLTATL